MKETIKRLRIKRTIVLNNAKFGVVSNPNEANDQLDVSIHETLSTGEVNSSKKPVELSKNRFFWIQINSGDAKGYKYGPNGEAVIIRKNVAKVPSYEAIYQFSVPFAKLLTRDNLIVIFEGTADEEAPTPDSEIAHIELFAEIEDNFVNVRLDRPGTETTKDMTLWDFIKSRWTDINNNTLKFNEYKNFIDAIILGPLRKDGALTDATLLRTKDFDNADSTPNRKDARFRSPFIKSEEYNLIKFATEFYMLAKFGMDTQQLGNYVVEGKLPYYKLIVDKLDDDASLKKIIAWPPKREDFTREEDVTYERIYNPIMVELIWSYWMEQGMLSQTMNVINLRFQNRKAAGYNDPLFRFDADPLRPLSHILWGYIQDEQHRLSLQRRVYEYDHEYGLTLTGLAVKPVTPVDSRVPFLEAFHNLLNQCIFYYYEADDTTRIADAFPILNSLKEVHLLLAEGNHNQYGNLTWTARHEMMIQQYILSRSEMREFLGGRVMVPYPEVWMDRVDAMRSIQGWGGPGIIHYYELAVHGEQILLSIRYGNWSDVTLDRSNAANWAQAFRNSIQRYIHAYRAVTGVDLSAERIQSSHAFALQPAFLIQQRLLQDRTRIRRA